MVSVYQNDADNGGKIRETENRAVKLHISLSQATNRNK